MAVSTRGAKRKMEGKENKKKEKKIVPVPLPLLHGVCLEIAKHVHESEALAFAMSCRGFRDAMKEALRSRNAESTAGKWLATTMKHWMKSNVPVTEDWIKWAFSMKWEYAEGIHHESKGALLTFLAGRSGFKDVLVWLKSKGCVVDSIASLGAVINGHIKVLKYLKSEGMAFDSDTCKDAAINGHIKVLEYLKSEGVPFDSRTCEGAAEGDHIEVLKYLKSEGAPFNQWSCLRAAERGHLEVLKWLRSEEVNCPCDETRIAFPAAYNGHLAVLQYVWSSGARIDRETCAAAAAGGHLDILKWLRSEEVKCDWDESTCHQALKRGDAIGQAIFQWALAHGCTYDGGTGNPA